MPIAFDTEQTFESLFHKLNQKPKVEREADVPASAFGDIL